MRRRALILAAVGAVVMLGLGPAIARADPATPWMVGAAKTDITPPAFDAGQDLIDFPEVDLARLTLCPRAVFNGPRKWRFEEPYIDVDGNGRFNYNGVSQDAVPEPYCDYNHNGRWDGIYISGGVDDPAELVHDPIDARAVAISDGDHTAVIASVVAQGLHENYVKDMKAEAQQLAPGITQMTVSANHNESSPDTIGIYGAPAISDDVPLIGGAAGLTSGIDEYYMDYLDGKVARAAADAYDALQPASLREVEFPLPSNVRVQLSKNFPTTNDDGSPAAIDPKVRVLQARDAGDTPIFTMMNLAAHNQEIGHHIDHEISSDWPGYFHSKLEDLLPGMAMFLVGDNGSEEDPITVPENPTCGEGCYPQAESTGDAFAEAVDSKLADATPVRAGEVSGEQEQLFTPLENNVFRAAAVLGLFGERQTYLAGAPAGRFGNELRTEVGVTTIGPDLQFVANPGEAFPGLIQGSPWGIEDAGCPNRANPPAPTWHASATHRFQIGLADDMTGYEIPAWAFSSLPGVFLNSDGNLDTCFNDTDDIDPAGHQHKLETEGVGPTHSNMIATALAGLLDQNPDSTAEIREGRFVMSDGTLSRRAQGAVGVWVADPGSHTLTPGSGTIVAIDGVGAFGDRAVDGNGEFMDYDGAAQPEPDITSRGMLIRDSGGVQKRYYLDVYPALDTTNLGPAGPGPPPPPPGSCTDVTAPSSHIDRAFGGHKRIRLRGTALDVGCTGTGGQTDLPGELFHAYVSVYKHVAGGECRFLTPAGLTRPRNCGNPVVITAVGTSRWKLTVRSTARLPSGRWHAVVRSADTRGNLEHRHRSASASFRIR